MSFYPFLVLLSAIGFRPLFVSSQPNLLLPERVSLLLPFLLIH